MENNSKTTSHLPPHERDAETFRNAVARLREGKGWTQYQLAKKLNEAGLEDFKQITVARLERGERAVKLGEAGVIARTLDSTVAQMLLPPGDFIFLQKTLKLGADATQTLEELSRLIERILDVHYRTATTQGKPLEDMGEHFNNTDMELIISARDSTDKFKSGYEIARVVQENLESIQPPAPLEKLLKEKFIKDFSKFFSLFHVLNNLNESENS